MSIKKTLQEIKNTKQLISNLKNGNSVELSQKDILNILEIHPTLDIFPANLLLNKTIFSDKLLFELVYSNLINLKYIDISRHTEEIYDLIFTYSDINLLKLKNIPLNLKLLNKIDIQKFSDLLQNIPQTIVKDFLKSLYTYNGLPELDKSHYNWKYNKKEVLKQFEVKSYEDLLSYYEETPETKNFVDFLFKNNKLINDFFIKLLETSPDNIVFLNNQLNNRLIKTIEELYYFEDNTYSLKYFYIIKEKFITKPMLNTVVNLDKTVLLNINENLVDSDIFDKIINKDKFDEKDKEIIIHLLKNKSFQTKENFDKIKQKSFDILFSTFSLFDKSFFLKEDILKLLENDLFKDYHYLFNNNDLNKILDESFIQSLLSKYSKKNIKIVLGEFLSTEMLNLLTENVEEELIKSIRYTPYNFFNIEKENQTEEFFQVFLESCVSSNLNSNEIIKNNLEKINVKFLQEQHLIDLILLNKVDLVINILKQREDLSNSSNLKFNRILFNRILSKRKDLLQYINKDLIEDKVILSNLLDFYDINTILKKYFRKNKNEKQLTIKH